MEGFLKLLELKSLWVSGLFHCILRGELFCDSLVLVLAAPRTWRVMGAARAMYSRPGPHFS